MRARSGFLAAAIAAGSMTLTSIPASAQALQFFAVLEGGSEVSAGGAAAAGDLDAHGTASIILGAPGALCFSLLVRNTDTPNAAHIHEAGVGRNGPVVVTLVRPAGGNPGARAGCLTGLSTAVLSRLRASPGRFYINVHTGAFPNGAVRGQLF